MTAVNLEVPESGVHFVRLSALRSEIENYDRSGGFHGCDHGTRSRYEQADLRCKLFRG